MAYHAFAMFMTTATCAELTPRFDWSHSGVANVCHPSYQSLTMLLIMDLHRICAIRHNMTMPFTRWPTNGLPCLCHVHDNCYMRRIDTKMWRETILGWLMFATVFWPIAYHALDHGLTCNLLNTPQHENAFHIKQHMFEARWPTNGWFRQGAQLASQPPYRPDRQ